MHSMYMILLLIFWMQFVQICANTNDQSLKELEEAIEVNCGDAKTKDTELKTLKNTCVSGKSLGF